MLFNFKASDSEEGKQFILFQISNVFVTENTFLFLNLKRAKDVE